MFETLEVTKSSKHQAAECSGDPGSSVAKTLLAGSRGTPAQVLIVGLFNVTSALFYHRPVGIVCACTFFSFFFSNVKEVIQ